jgi:hypothetical protein
MSKLLVNAPNGLQELVEVQDGGGYFDSTLVIWDERTDGQLPPITLGSMKRVGNALVQDATVFAQLKATQDAENIELAKTQYQRDRAKEYPPIGDQLDALWKGGDAATTMLAQVQAVKAKYPKPDAP